jgi:hypothetical protein
MPSSKLLPPPKNIENSEFMELIKTDKKMIIILLKFINMLYNVIPKKYENGFIGDFLSDVNTITKEKNFYEFLLKMEIIFNKYDKIIDNYNIDTGIKTVNESLDVAVFDNTVSIINAKLNAIRGEFESPLKEKVKNLETNCTFNDIFIILNNLITTINEIPSK